MIIILKFIDYFSLLLQIDLVTESELNILTKKIKVFIYLFILLMDPLLIVFIN